MSAESLPLKFQIGAHTLAAMPRQLVRVPLSLDQVLTGTLPALPPLERDADGYLVTSLPEERLAAMIAAGGGMIAHVRQRYTRSYADLTLGFDAYRARLSGNTRSSLKRKAARVMAVSGGKLDVRRFRSAAELGTFHDTARWISRRTYQERLLGGGLPDDATFVQCMYELATADAVRAWLLYIAGEPAAYLYCTIEQGTVRYDHVGHDPAFNDLSPGGVLMMEAIRDLYAEPGLQRFDFTEGDGQHKRSFATAGVACVDLLLLRVSLANRVATVALDGFDRWVAWGKRTAERLGLERVTKRVRR